MPLFPQARCVLGFFPHPDDEAYAAAGTLARCARDGLRVELLCATRGEAGSDRAGGRSAQELARLRSRELAEACRAIGAEPPRFLDFVDGDVRVDDASVAHLVEALRRSAPDVVVTLGRDGAYGHRDHLACTRLLDEAVERMGFRGPVLHAAFPKGVFLPVWRALRRSHPQVIGIDDGAELGSDRARVDLIVDLRGQRQIKLDALRAHDSQLRDGDPRSFLRPGLVDALLDEEWFIEERRDEGPAPHA